MLLTLLLGCSDPLPLSNFGPPAFDPVRFFTGTVRSWGVMENRDGSPSGIVETDCIGTAEGSDGLRMTQTLRLPEGRVQTREWRMRRVVPGRFEATANDMVGTAIGEASGRAFHWIWTLATRPGESLRDVTMEQWMYGVGPDAMMNRTTVRKWGVTIAQVTEHFVRAPSPVSQ